MITAPTPLGNADTVANHRPQADESLLAHLHIAAQDRTGGDKSMTCHLAVMLMTSSPMLAKGWMIAPS